MALGVSTTFETFPETCQYFYNESFHDVPAGHFPTEIRSSQHFAALTNRVGCRSPSKHVNLTPTYGTQRSSGFPPCSPNPLSGSCASLEGGSPPCQTRGRARKGIWELLVSSCRGRLCANGGFDFICCLSHKREGWQNERLAQSRATVTTA